MTAGRPARRRSGRAATCTGWTQPGEEADQERPGVGGRRGQRDHDRSPVDIGGEPAMASSAAARRAARHRRWPDRPRTSVGRPPAAAPLAAATVDGRRASATRVVGERDVPVGRDRSRGARPTASACSTTSSGCADVGQQARHDDAVAPGDRAQPRVTDPEEQRRRGRRAGPAGRPARRWPTAAAASCPGGTRCRRARTGRRSGRPVIEPRPPTTVEVNTAKLGAGAVLGGGEALGHVHEQARRRRRRRSPRARTRVSLARVSEMPKDCAPRSFSRRASSTRPVRLRRMPRTPSRVTTEHGEAQVVHVGVAARGRACRTAAVARAVPAGSTRSTSGSAGSSTR